MMKIEAGKELEFVGHRLSDIEFLAGKTRQVGDDWESYAKQLRRMILTQAQEARTALSLISG